MSKKTIRPVLPLFIAASLALAGCSSPATPSPSSASQGAAGLSMGEPWVKASADGMTGAFGIVTNNTDRELVVVGASTPSASMVQLHETVKGDDGATTMRAKEGGFTVPAHGEFRLEPGANHIMLMGLAKPLAPGDVITVELETSDGGQLTFSAPAKDFSGANENYEGSHGGGESHGTMDHPSAK